MPEKTEKKKLRSPNFPGINLEEAIQKAATLYKIEGRHPAARKVILDHWGYGEKSSSGLVALGALRAFGLLEGRGNQNQLTNLAKDIILDEEPDSKRRAEAIQDAALTPSIHKELWEKYDGSLPSDAQLRFFLRGERAFTDKGADDFIAQFRATLAFAKLPGDDKLDDEPEGESKKPHRESPGGALEPSPRAETPGMNQDVFTLESGKVVLQYPTHLSGPEFEDLKSWLGLIQKRIARGVQGEPDGTPEKAPEKAD